MPQVNKKLNYYNNERDNELKTKILVSLSLKFNNLKKYE